VRNLFIQLQAPVAGVMLVHEMKGMSLEFERSGAFAAASA